MRTTMMKTVLLAAVLILVSAIFAADNIGIVSGTVNHPTVKKYPTVVYIDDLPAPKGNAPPSKVNIDQKGKVFFPRVVTVQVGSTVEYLNSDPFEHNVFSPDGEKYDLGNWGKGDKRSYTFKRPGVYTQLCKLHPDMIAYVVVLKNPYFAIADDQGKYRITNVPVGAWALKIWNERLRPNQLEKPYPVTIDPRQESKLDIAF